MLYNPNIPLGVLLAKRDGAPKEKWCSSVNVTLFNVKKAKGKRGGGGGGGHVEGFHSLLCPVRLREAREEHWHSEGKRKRGVNGIRQTG